MNLNENWATSPSDGVDARPGQPTEDQTLAPRPHEALEGRVLPGGWTVESRLLRPPDATGGRFSCGYLVRDEGGREGYLKAFDFYSGLPQSPDPSRELEPMVRAFNFERELLEQCRERRMSRVVRSYDHGVVSVSTPTGDLPVQYIVFELASGDVRDHLRASSACDANWAMCVLHHVAVGLNQLHTMNVTHQDIKPSNVLTFSDAIGSKIADLGRAAQRGNESPHDDLQVPGELGYAPPELLYAGGISDWESRRAADCFLLGSLISSLFTGVGVTALAIYGVPPELHWRKWSGRYSEALLFLRPAFDDAFNYVAEEMPVMIRQDLSAALRQLCDPDPLHRGHPRDRAARGSSYAMHRFISLFNRMSLRRLR